MRHFTLGVLLLLTALRAVGQPTEEYTTTFGVAGAAIETSGNMIHLADGNLLVCGQWSDGRPFLHKLDPAGRTIFRQLYYLPGNDGVLKDVVELPNGNIAATEACRDCLPGDSSYTLLNLLTDPTGFLLHRQEHGQAGVVDFGYGIAHRSGGGLVVVGHRGDSSFVFRYDDALFLQDSIFMRGNGATEEYGYDIVATASGELFMTGRALVGWKPHVLLRKMDSLGVEIWSKRFYEDSNTGMTAGWQILPWGTGSVVVCGSRYHNPARSGDIFLTEFSADTGAVLTERLFGTDQIDAGYALSIAGDDLLLAGLIRRPLVLGGLWRSVIYRLDSGLTLVDSTLYDAEGLRDLPSGVAALDAEGKDFAYCGISISQNYQEQDIYWGRHLQRGNRAVLTEFPQPQQLYPRDLTTNLGRARIHGYVTDSTQPFPYVRLRVRRDHQVIALDTRLLEFIADTAGFAFDYDFPAELHNYDFELVLTAGFAAESPEATAINVVAGDAYLLTGQSNAVASQRGAGSAPENPWIRTYGSGNPAGFPPRWFVGKPNAEMDVDGNLGQLGLTFGDRIVQWQRIPVAILNGGHIGQQLLTFVPNPTQPALSTNYGRTLTRADEAGLTEAIRSVVFWQGETDAFFGSVPGFYFPLLDSLRRSWERDFPAVEDIFLFQIKNGCLATNGLGRTMTGQFDYADTVANVHLLSTTGLDHLPDDCHYDLANGYRDAGEQLYERMRPFLYGGPVLPNTVPPMPDSAWFPDCDRTRIRIALRNPTDTYQVDANLGVDFLLPDTSVHVSQAVLQGHVLELTLDDSLLGSATLSYYGHPGPAAPYLSNASGIGMVTFKDLPVNCRAEIPVIGRPPRGRVKIDVRAQIISISNKGGNAPASAGASETTVMRARITDLYGRVIWRGNGAQLRRGVPLPGLARAVYFLQLEYSDGSVEVRRVFIN